MRHTIVALIGAALLFAGGCATMPDTPADQNDLISDADATLQRMQSRDPTLMATLQRSAGYAVFPDVGKGGAIVGGAYGRGVLYENGQPTAFVSLSQASIGAQIGGASFSELIIFETQEALESLRNGDYMGGTQVNATAFTAGAAGSTEFQDGIATLVEGGAGLMLDASFAGQRLGYEPMEPGMAK